MSSTVIIGAGGHAREVLDILLDRRASGQDVEPVGFIDENSANHGKMLNGYPVLGDFGWFRGVDRTTLRVVCAVGSPELCRKLVQKALSLGLSFGNAISSRACISPSARIGRGVIIFPNVVVNTDAAIGNHVTLNVGASVSHDTVVGDFCNVNPGARLAGNVVLGEGCYVGMGASVIQGVSVGVWSTIGAGAVAVRDIPPGATAVGVPAQVIGNKPGT